MDSEWKFSSLDVDAHNEVALGSVPTLDGVPFPVVDENRMRVELVRVLNEVRRLTQPTGNESVVDAVKRVVSVASLVDAKQEIISNVRKILSAGEFELITTAAQRVADERTTARTQRDTLLHEITDVRLLTRAAGDESTVDAVRRVAAVACQVNTLQEEMQRVEADRDYARNECEEVNDYATAQRKMVSEVRTILSARETELTINAAKRFVDEHNEILEKRNSIVAKLIEEHNELQKQHEAWSKEHDSVVAERDALRKEISDARSELGWSYPAETLLAAAKRIHMAFSAEMAANRERWQAHINERDRLLGIIDDVARDRKADDERLRVELRALPPESTLQAAERLWRTHGRIRTLILADAAESTVDAVKRVVGALAEERNCAIEELAKHKQGTDELIRMWRAKLGCDDGTSVEDGFRWLRDERDSLLRTCAMLRSTKEHGASAPGIGISEICKLTLTEPGADDFKVALERAVQHSRSVFAEKLCNAAAVYTPFVSKKQR